ncbi:TetR/AcrR family transcriptional regulator [Herbiconiux liukaitaii]|uniref:TetR/AcrR family transcriptional regulator n=1 Tax=Herbiconiux liukaitaii TaxID=3342799 RepID=UPI0035B898D4
MTTTTTAKVGRMRSTADAQRSRILEASLGGFAHKGYHATPVTEIAELAGVSPAYVFRLFPGKLGLFVATIDHCYERVTEALVAGGEKVGDAPSDTVLDAMTEAYIDLIEDRSLIMLQGHAQSACDIPEIREAVQRGVGMVVENVARVSGAEPAAVQYFLAFGQLCHLIVQAELTGVPAGWAETITAGIRHK